MKPEEFQAGLNGVICEAFTPYKADNPWEVDHDALRQNLKFLIKNGVRSVTLTSNGGECPGLEDEERMAVWKTAVDEAKGKLLLIAANGHYSQKGALALTKYGEKIGVDGFMTIAPSYRVYNSEGLYRYYKEIAESTSLGVIVYNNPPYAKVNITPVLMDKLAQIPNIVGLQESAGDMDQFYSVLRVMGKYHKPVIGMGESWYLIGSIVSDASTGFLSLTTNWWPEGVTMAASAIEKKDIPSAASYLRKMTPYVTMMARIAKLRQHSWLAVSKEPMDMIEGVKGGLVRLPLTPLTDAERAELKGILMGLGLKLRK